MDQSLLLPQLQPSQSTALPPPGPQPPPPPDTFLIVPTHYGGGRTSVDFPFLAYLGYKTFGWVVVFIAVLILLRFVKLWLLHAWVREAGIGGGEGSGFGGGRGGALRDEVVYEICLRVEGQDNGEGGGGRRLNRALIGLGRRRSSRSRSARRGPEDEDSPPDYAEVTGGHRAAVSNEDDGKRVNDEGAEAAVPPPEYSTLFVEGEREQGD